MKLNRWVVLTTTTSVLALFVFCSNKKSTGSDGFFGHLMGVLQYAHYQPKEVDDSLSAKVYENLLGQLDRTKHFFTQEDLKQLSAHKYSIDDQIKAGRFDFFDQTWQTLHKRIDVLQPFIEAELSKPYVYNGNEEYVLEDEPQNYMVNEAALLEDWKRWLKFQSLERLSRKMESQKKMKDSASASKIKPYDTLELGARNETKKFYADWFKRLKKMDRRDQIAMYANAISEVYDPHTEYFPPEDKDNFDIGMTGKLEGIGATLTERDGYIKVERIVPGSASYRQGELKAGDLILKVAQGSAEPVDVVDMKLDDAIQLIRGKKGTEVRLTVKKPDGKTQVIPIIREVVVIEDTYARSAIINYQGLSLGLIQLPSFYADFSTRGRGRHSSEDVRLEIEKLKEAGVKGIILDLRNNGGGSLQDAIDMGGLFIPQGPIVQVKDARGVEVYSDRDPAVNYSGPLVVLVNTYSASASEILAAAMQDYNRAIIIGTKSTFGKGTVQTFVPLEGGVTDVFPRGYGQLKVTIQKFYRINGGTTQLMGVVPDVILPDLYDGIEQGEKEMDYHLAYDKIPSAVYSPFNPYKEDRRKLAIKQTNAKKGGSEYFGLVINRSEELAKQRKSYTYSLNLEKFEKQQEALRNQDKPLKDFKYRTVADTIMPLAVDMDAVKGDKTKEALKLDWLKRYKEDAVFDMGLFAMSDWIGETTAANVDSKKKSGKKESKKPSAKKQSSGKGESKPAAKKTPVKAATPVSPM